MFCTNCGVSLDDDMLFCPNCGTKVAHVQEEEKSAEPAKVAEEPKKAEEEPVKAAEEPKKAEEEPVKAAEEPKKAEEEPVKAAEEPKKAEEEPAKVAEEPKKAEEEPAKAAEEPKKAEEEPAKAAEEPKKAEEEPIKAAEEPKKAEEEPVKAAEPEKPEDKPEDKPGKKQKTKGIYPKPKGGVAFLCVLLCMLTFMAGVAGSMVLSLHLAYSENKIHGMIEGLEVSEVTLPDAAFQKEVSLVDFLEKAGDFDFENTAGIAKKDLEIFFGKPYVLEMVADFIADYSQYFFQGRKPKALTRDDVVEFLGEHNDDILKLTGFSFVYQDPASGKNVVYTTDIDNAFADLGTDEITIGWIEREFDFSFDKVKLLLSLYFVIGLYVLAVLLIILVFVLNRKTIRSGFSFVGMTMILAGLLLDAGACVVFFLPKKIPGTLIKVFLSPLGKNLLLVGSSILAVGLLLFVFGRMICGAVIRRKLAKQEQSVRQAA